MIQRLNSWLWWRAIRHGITAESYELRDGKWRQMHVTMGSGSGLHFKIDGVSADASWRQSFVAKHAEARMVAWQPIDTSPSDRILISDGQYVAIAMKTISGEWQDDDGNGLPQPTHWMPTPACPA